MHRVIEEASCLSPLIQAFAARTGCGGRKATLVETTLAFCGERNTTSCYYIDHKKPHSDTTLTWTDIDFGAFKWINDALIRAQLTHKSLPHTERTVLDMNHSIQQHGF